VKTMSLENSEWVNQIAGAVAGMLGALIALVYKSTHKRIDVVVETVEKKADSAQVVAATTKIDKLYDALNDHVSEESRQFGRIYDVLHANHIEVIRELNKKADK
jgi:hypothetical protein